MKNHQRFWSSWTHTFILHTLQSALFLSVSCFLCPATSTSTEYFRKHQWSPIWEFLKVVIGTSTRKNSVLQFHLSQNHFGLARNVEWMLLVQKMRKSGKSEDLCSTLWVPNMFYRTPFRRLPSAPTLLSSPTTLKHVFCLQTGNDFWKDLQTFSTKIILLISAPLWRYNKSDIVCHLSNILSSPLTQKQERIPCAQNCSSSATTNNWCSGWTTIFLLFLPSVT